MPLPSSTRPGNSVAAGTPFARLDPTAARTRATTASSLTGLIRERTIWRRSTSVITPMIGTMISSASLIWSPVQSRIVSVKSTKTAKIARVLTGQMAKPPTASTTDVASGSHGSTDTGKTNALATGSTKNATAKGTNHRWSGRANVAVSLAILRGGRSCSRPRSISSRDDPQKRVVSPAVCKRTVRRRRAPCYSTRTSLRGRSPGVGPAGTARNKGSCLPPTSLPMRRLIWSTRTFARGRCGRPGTSSEPHARSSAE